MISPNLIHKGFSWNLKVTHIKTRSFNLKFLVFWWTPRYTYSHSYAATSNFVCDTPLKVFILNDVVMDDNKICWRIVKITQKEKEVWYKLEGVGVFPTPPEQFTKLALVYNIGEESH